MKFTKFNSLEIGLSQNIIIMFCLSFIFNPMFSEGTKELRPTEASFGSLNLMDSRNGLNKERTFALYSATDETRLNIRIDDFVNESIYFGFNVNGTDDLFFRIKDPNGVVVFGPQLVPQTDGDLGKIIDYDEAVLGPNVLVAGGYSAFNYQPTMAGDFSIEFDDPNYDPSNGDYPKRSLELFDFTVYDNSTSIVKTGRLWSNAWDLTTKGSANEFDGSVYIYTDDGITTKANFNGFQPFSFIIQSNSTGPKNTGDLISDRQSSLDGVLLPEYMIFLNEPDPLEFPVSTVPEINSVPAFDFCDLSTDQCIEIELSNPGEVNYIIDIAGGPGFDDPRDLSFETSVEAGLNCLPWDGLDGEGNPLTLADTFDIILNYRAGVTHLFIYDAENNSNGFNVEHVSPTTGLGEPFLYYDDTPLGGNSDFIGCNSNCHLWDSNFGNDETVNTWWVTFFENDTIKDIHIDFSSSSSEVDIDITTPALCGENSMVLDTVNVKNDGVSSTVSWFINGILESSNATFSPTGLSEGDIIWAVLQPSEICYEPDTAELVVSLPLIPIVNNDSEICSGDSLTLTASNTNDFFRWLVDGAEVSREKVFKVAPLESTVYVAQNASSSSKENLIINGDFEDGLNGFTSDYTFVQDVTSGVETFTINSLGSNASSNFYPVEDISFGHESNMLIAEGSLASNSILYETTVNVVDGLVYDFSFWAVSLENTLPSALTISINNESPVIYELDGTDQWGQYSSFWESSITGAITIQITNLGIIGSQNNFALDEIRFSEFEFCESSVTIDVQEKVEASLQLNSSSACSGDTVIFTLSDTTNMGSSPVFEWYVNDVVQSENEDTLLRHDLKDNDSVSVILTSSLTECIVEKDTSSYLVEIFSKPSVSILKNEICEGDTASLVTTVSGQADPVTHSWSSTGNVIGSTDNPKLNTNPLITTTYSLIIEDNNGCKDTTDYELIVHTKPNVSVLGDEICAGDTVNLTTVVSDQLDPVDYSWTPSESLTSDNTSEVGAFPKFTTRYDLIIEDGNGCRDTTDYELIVHSKPSVTINGSDVCGGASTNLTSLVQDFTAPVVYSWSTGEVSSDVTVTPASPTVYTLAVEDDNACKADTSFTVGVTSLPISSINESSTSICSNQSLNLTAFEDASQNYSFSWQSSSDNISFSDLSNTQNSQLITETGHYRLEVRNDGICPVTSTSVFVEVVQVQDLSVSLDELPVYCEGQDLSVTAQILNGGTSPTLTWEYNILPVSSSTATVNIDGLIASEGTLKLTVESDLSCVNETNNSDEVMVKVLAKPSPAIISLGDTLCETSPETLIAQDLSGNVNSYQWILDGENLQDENSLELNDVNTGGEYVLSAWNEACLVEYSDSVNMVIYNVPFVDASVSLDNKEVYMFGDQIVLSGSHDGESSMWSTAEVALEIEDEFSGVSTLEVPGGGEYTLVLTSFNGACSSSDSVYLDINLPIKAPNVFTPNGDGQNDTFHFTGIETRPDATVTIFNRWGVVIYESQDYASSEWEAVNVPDGVYYFLVTLPEQEEGKGYTGVVHVLR